MSSVSKKLLNVRALVPWRALLLFATWWLALQAFALLAFNRFHLTAPDEAYTWTSQISGLLPMPWRSFVDLHARFDSGFYTWIAGEGYNAQNAAFLPLYPLLIRLGVLLWCAPQQLAPPACDYAAVAFIVSNLGALGASIAVFTLARLDFDEARSQQALFYFLIFPTAFFLTANYTESLFVLLAAASFYAARRERWALASVIGVGAMLTRAVGFALFAALLAEWWTQRRARDWRGVTLLLMPLTLVAFEWYLNARGLSFFATEQALWNRAPFTPDALLDHLEWERLRAYPAAQVNLMLDVGIALFVVTASAVAAWRWRLSYGVFGALCILLPLTTGQLISLSRYGLVAFTVPLLLARYAHQRWLDRAYTLSAILLLALFVMLFVQGYWAG